MLNTFGEDSRNHADLIRKIVHLLGIPFIFLSQLEIIYYQGKSTFPFIVCPCPVLKASATRVVQ